MRFDSLFDQVGVVCCGRAKSLYVGSGLFCHLLIAGLKLVLSSGFGLSDLPVDSPAFFPVQFSVCPAMPATAFSGSPVSEGSSHAVPDAPAGCISPFAVGGKTLYHAFFSYRFRGVPYDLAYVLQKGTSGFKLADGYRIHDAPHYSARLTAMRASMKASISDSSQPTELAPSLIGFGKSSRVRTYVQIVALDNPSFSDTSFWRMIRFVLV